MKNFKLGIIFVFILAFTIMFVSSYDVINIENITNATTCTDQLHFAVNEYNNLLVDFKNGTNCGIGFQLVKDLNAELVIQRDECFDNLEKWETGERLHSGSKDYKVGFWAVITLAFILSIILFKKEPKKD